MKIGIIGAGAMGAELAALWSRAGHQVSLSSRTSRTAALAAARIGHGVRVSAVRDVALEADVVVLATPFEAIPEALDRVSHLEGRILVDMTNPYRRNAEGALVRMLAPHVSAASTVARRVPGARLVKAYSTVPSQALLPGAQRRDGVPLAVFYCGDDRGAKSVVGELVCDSGFAPIDIGGIDRALDIETAGPLCRRGLLPAPQARELLLAEQPLWPRAA